MLPDATPTVSDSVQSVKVPAWEVTMLVSGPIKVRNHIRLLEPKNSPRRDLYYSNLLLRDVPHGIRVSAEARAQTAPLARRAAVVFIGQMLDVLAFRVDLPLYVGLIERQAALPESHTERRIVEEPEWHSAFEESRLLSFAEPAFLRALGWYRKGLYTEDPFDSFLAFWNSIEVVATKYHPGTDKTDLGSKEQIKACFTSLWGPDCAGWPFIQGDEAWVRDNYECRKNIVHGIAAVTAKEIDSVFVRIDPVKQVAHAFLAGWRDRQLDPSVPTELQEKFGQLGGVPTGYQ